MGENIFMLPSDMNLNIRSGTARYNNKIFISNKKFSLGKNEKVNALALEEPVISTPKMKSHKYSTNSLQGLAHTPNISHKKNNNNKKTGTQSQ